MHGVGEVGGGEEAVVRALDVEEGGEEVDAVVELIDDCEGFVEEEG